ncbi:hypothetical protein GW17_00007062 [Ensete ventricosum]|nr:hypothetical protein GW17_00007062 [Ensete ventricosum]
MRRHLRGVYPCDVACTTFACETSLYGLCPCGVACTTSALPMLARVWLPLDAAFAYVWPSLDVASACAQPPLGCSCRLCDYRLRISFHSFYMMPKTKGASMHMHFISEKYLMEELRRPNLRRTFMESSISCSHGGRVLVVKGAEEVENVEANSKYQDKAEGQRPENFIRPMSMSFSLR